MMNFIELASSAIIDKLKTILDQDVAVSDRGGVIVATSDLSIYGKEVAAAKAAVSENKTTRVPESQLKRGLAAWATPLTHNGRLIGSLIIRNDERISQEKISLARSLAELLIQQTMVLRILPTTSQMLDKFFYDLLESENKNKNEILNQSRFLDTHYYKTRLETDRVVFLVNLPGFWKRLLGKNIVPQAEELEQISRQKEKLKEILSPYSKALRDTDILAVYFSGDNFVALITSPESASAIASAINKNLEKILKALKTKMNGEIKIVPAQTGPGLDGLIKSYETAKSILSVGLKLYANREIYQPDDTLLPQLLGKIPKQNQELFIENALAKIADKKELLDTIDTYFSTDLNLRATAEKLNVHKNTLYYRFNIIKKLTGVNLRSFQQAMKLALARIMMRINEDENISPWR